ncbi:hypothetical protein [Parachlamydia sp. AcF125]|uniref:hypothetical protein n=1 Tax=Parachlamydia sp. AcF125 TaxID=2795736 RepID=UPI001BC9F112|nr:hypothetical protein [Parachlamydia sp. AcF125]MBS4167853.1 hypothetical protein [Parachlamydia sp. AcF125]
MNNLDPHAPLINSVKDTQTSPSNALPKSEANQVEQKVGKAAAKVLGDKPSSGPSIPATSPPANSDSSNLKEKNQAAQSHLSKVLRFLANLFPNKSKKSQTGQKNASLKEAPKWQENGLHVPFSQKIASSEAISKKMGASPEAQEAKKKNFSVARFLRSLISYVKAKKNQLFKTKKTTDAETANPPKLLPSRIEAYHHLIKQMNKRLQDTIDNNQASGIPEGLFRESGSQNTVNQMVREFIENKGSPNLPKTWNDAANLIKRTVMAPKAPMAKFRALNLPEIYSPEKTDTENIQAMRRAIGTLAPEEKQFLNDYLKMLALAYQTWKITKGEKIPFLNFARATPNLERVFLEKTFTDTLEVPNPANVSLTERFAENPLVWANQEKNTLPDYGYVEFLVDNRQLLFQINETTA